MRNRQRKREKNLHKEIYNDRLNVYGGFTTSHRTLGAINEHSINSHMHENTSLQSAKKKRNEIISYTVHTTNSRHSRRAFTVFHTHRMEWFQFKSTCTKMGQTWFTHEKSIIILFVHLKNVCTFPGHDVWL